MRYRNVCNDQLQVYRNPMWRHIELKKYLIYDSEHFALIQPTKYIGLLSHSIYEFSARKHVHT